MVAEKKQYDPQLKSSAVQLVEDGMSMARVAAKFDVSATTVRKWVRIARGPYKKRIEKKLIVDKSRRNVDGKEYRYKGNFTANDKNGMLHLIFIFREWTKGCSVSNETSTDAAELLFTKTFKPVRRLRKGLYKLETGPTLESFDPDAP